MRLPPVKFRRDCLPRRPLPSRGIRPIHSVSRSSLRSTRTAIRYWLLPTHRSRTWHQRRASPGFHGGDGRSEAWRSLESSLWSRTRPRPNRMLSQDAKRQVKPQRKRASDATLGKHQYQTCWTDDIGTISGGDACSCNAAAKFSDMDTWGIARFCDVPNSDWNAGNSSQRSRVEHCQSIVYAGVCHDRREWKSDISIFDIASPGACSDISRTESEHRTDHRWRSDGSDRHRSCCVFDQSAGVME